MKELGSVMHKFKDRNKGFALRRQLGLIRPKGMSLSPWCNSCTATLNGNVIQKSIVFPAFFLPKYRSRAIKKQKIGIMNFSFEL